MKSSSLVWYASYGSNMDAGRFSRYILGGIFEETNHQHAGCDDKTLPVQDVLIDLPLELYFAGESRQWGGGVAFVKPNTLEVRTKSRAYLVTLGQFEQIAAQESSRETHSLDVDLLRSQGYLVMGDGSKKYDKILYCGEKDGYPVITFTSPLELQVYAKPEPTYLRTIAAGLKDFHGLDDQEVIEYLIVKPGVQENYSSDELSELLVRMPSQMIYT
jgi:hypothetical protein